MRAATTRGPGALLAITEVNDPVPSPQQLLVRVEACGICGSDLHIADRPDSAGRILGHEFSGEVVSVGSEVEGFHGGERIAVFPVVGCGVCRACVNGNPTNRIRSATPSVLLSSRSRSRCESGKSPRQKRASRYSSSAADRSVKPSPCGQSTSARATSFSAIRSRTGVNSPNAPARAQRLTRLARTSPEPSGPSRVRSRAW